MSEMVLGTQLQVGQEIAVWWAPRRARILKLHGLCSHLNAELWDGKAQVAVLTAPNCRSGQLEMTIEPNALFEVFV